MVREYWVSGAVGAIEQASVVVLQTSSMLWFEVFQLHGSKPSSLTYLITLQVSQHPVNKSL